jgi:hypothetical protein
MWTCGDTKIIGSVILFVRLPDSVIRLFIRGQQNVALYAFYSKTSARDDIILTMKEGLM